ncbi:hypothetical protein FSP39_015442 [Pinctada imbricata]|uniref:Cadherin domain-containing protein n=1 Tax=Pinctada imbricata TaxID=66713 RepID=A0AA88Y8J5_PINIB|nr:hypothetical protein FSP39_015442 [Pinctada imbricata]
MGKGEDIFYLFLLVVYIPTLCVGDGVRMLFHVREEQAPNTYIGQVDTVKAPPPYNYIDSNPNITVNLQNGNITTAVRLDRESRALYTVSVLSMDNFEVVEVTINVTDINDHSPYFPNGSKVIELSEISPNGSKVLLGSVIDEDVGSNGIGPWSIVSGNEDNDFKLETKRSGNNVLYMDLVIIRPLDYETTPSYSLHIRVYDGGSPPNHGDIRVNITILDANDNTPRFTHTKYSTIIPEDVQIGTSIIQVNATDLDSGENGRISYYLDGNRDPESQFFIEKSTGIIRINKPLDYERRTRYELSVIARDNGSQPLDANAVVEVNVTNVNEKPANINLVFLADGSTNQSTKISENSSIGSVVAHISVSDPDKPNQYFANVNVTLGGDMGRFGLTTDDQVVYKVVLQQSLDREAVANYNLTVIAVDSGTPPLHATKSFTVFVTDVNDNAPYFTQNVYSASLQEQAPAGNSVIKVTANDDDFGENARVSYSIKAIPGTDHDWFQIDQNTGLITTRGDSNVDCEQNSHPRITVVATDNGLPPQTATAIVDITIHDVNDLEPVFERSYYEGRIAENVAVGTSILTVSATDPDCNSNTQVFYYLKNYTTPQQQISDAFSIDRNSGILRVAKQLDYETRQSYEFTVFAEDLGNLDGSALIKVTLSDVNDNAPRFYPTNYSTNIEMTTQIGKEIIAVQASDLDSGSFQEIQFSIVGSGNNEGYFTVNTTGTSGHIYLTRSLPREERVYILNIRATDGGGLTSPQDATVYISVTGDNSHPPVFRQPTYKFSISESVSRGIIVGNVTADVHNTGTDNAGVTYSITYGNQAGYFIIYEQTGVIAVDKPLDHDTHPFVLLSVKAETGVPPVFGTAQVNITITDINDNAPVFTSPQLQITVKEDESLATTLYPAKATDADSGQNSLIRYSLLENPQSLFQINAVTGELMLQSHLDYENATEHHVVIAASDQGTPPLSSNMTLVVLVRNVNDNPPVFTQAVFVKEVEETIPIGKEILQINATDLDKDTLSYSLADNSYSDTFGLFGTTGWIYLRKELDREIKEEYAFNVIAKDSGGISKTATAQVNIRVKDVNDNSPIFSQNEYVFEIAENLSQGTIVGDVLATDADQGSNAQLQYSFTDSNIPFAISPYNGRISTSNMLDREARSKYDLIVTVTDQGTPPKLDTANVKVIVKDINDNAPTFLNKQPLEVMIGENRPKGTSVVKMVAYDQDEKENGTLTFKLTGGDEGVLDLFEINPKSGLITSLEVLDYEQKNNYNLIVMAKDGGNPPKSSNIDVTVRVKDDNDEQPYFPTQEMTLRVVENTATGSIIGKVVATDGDSGENGRVSYYVVAGNHFQLFALNISTGDIYVIRKIDYEQASSHTIGIKAIDNSVYNPKSSTINVIIEVEDINDNPPEFEQDPVILTRRENLPMGHVIYTFTATDRDSGPNGTVQYTIESQRPDKGYLTVDPNTGKLSIAKSIDYEETRQLSLTVKAEDSAPKTVDRLHSTVTVWLFIQDENDNAPVFKGNSSFRVLENEPVGFPVAHILAVDADSNINNSRNNIIVYEITSGNQHGDFNLNSSRGELTIERPLDRETTTTYSLTIQASDQGLPRQSTLTVINVEILDVNDNAPRFINSTYIGTITEGSYTDKLILAISATDADSGENSQLTYSLPEGTANNIFTLDSTTGQIRVKQGLDREVQSSYILTAYVKDNGYPVQFDMTTIIINVTDVNDNTPTFTEQNVHLEVPENTQQPFIHKVLATDKDAGENARLRFSIIGGNTNNAFSIDESTGQLSCRALDREDVSQYSLTIQVQDHGSPPLSSTSNVVVKVLDKNDNFPRFSKQEYSVTIVEDIVMGGFVLQVSATDADEGENAKITYSLGNDTDGLFQVDSATGNITTNGHFDREKKATYLFHVVAKDGGLNNIRNTTIPVRINIGDVNDNAPIFREIPYHTNLSLNTPANRFVIRVEADDKDAGLNGEVRYELNSAGTDLRAFNYFRVDSVSGDIYTSQTVGSDVQGSFMLQIKAKDLGNPEQSSTGMVQVVVGGVSGSVSLRFQQQSYTATFKEHSGTGTFVTQVAAQYVGLGNGTITYGFINALDDLTFNIISSNGQIFVRDSSRLDYETTPVVTLIVTASSSNLFAYTTVTITLQDINDNQPKFAQDVYFSSTWEAQEQLNVFVTQVLATDADSGDNSDLIYNIIGGNDQNAFDIFPPHTGIVVTKLPLDFEITPKYELVIEAVDKGNPPQTGTCVLKINVVDVNDQAPNFPVPVPVNISEDADVGTQVAQVTANDVDTNPTLLYDFTPQGNPGQTFSIDRFSGRITLARPLDHEERVHFVLQLVVNDTKHTDFTILDVYVADENDNAPKFSQQSYQKTVAELTPAGTHVLTVNATDADSGINARLTYRLGLSLTDGFYINSATGAIYTNKTVEHRPDQQILTLIVTAEDAGIPRLSAVVAVHLQITPVNQYAPQFVSTNYTFYVSEDKQKGMDILRVNATDADRNQQITYSINGGNTNQMFEISRKSGQIFLSGNLDRETVARYSLIVSATDSGIQPKSASTVVTIVVVDVNDMVPYFDQSEYKKNLSENFQSGVSFMQVKAHDDDEGMNNEIQYAITSGNDQGLFIVYGDTGNLIITPSMSLDYEHSAVHKLIVRATDCKQCPSGHKKNSAFATITINVEDVNEHKPVFPVPFYYATVYENRNNNTPVFQAHANDKDAGRYGIVTYRLNSSNVFRINPTTGVVYTAMQLDYEDLPYLPKGVYSYQFHIYATDIGGNEDIVLVKIQIRDEDEFDPIFHNDKYSFTVPGSAKPGFVVGQVNASDQDQGLAGRVFYILKQTSDDYFSVNLTTGILYVSSDFNARRKKRDVSHARHKRSLNSNSVNLVIEATSGMEGSNSATTIVNIDIDESCSGCALVSKQPKEESISTTIILVIVFAIVAVILVIVIVVIILRFRSRKSPPPVAQIYETDYNGQFDFPITPVGPPPYEKATNNNSINVTTPDVSDRSHHSASSGRGSVEAEDDEEIMMINSNTSYLNNSSGFRSKNMPDSGIQDDDNNSEPSVQNSKDYLARLGIDSSNIQIKSQNIMQSVESMHQFSDEGGGEGIGDNIVDYNNQIESNTDVLHERNNRDLGFHEPDSQHVGALSSVINSEEEYSGSYNWDYLLDWGPQYQPLAHVFTEIARLKDDNLQPKKQPIKTVPQRKVNTNFHLHPQVKMDPPPIITNAPPRSIQASNSRSSHGKNSVRTSNSTMNTSLPSLPRSPISHESSFTSPALTPSFTPSLSPLATRSPSISPMMQGSSGQTTPHRQRHGSNRMYSMAISSESEQELRI